LPRRANRSSRSVFSLLRIFTYCYRRHVEVKFV